VAGFTFGQCTYDQRDGSQTCQAGTPGTIDVSWARDGFSETYSSGLFRQSTTAWTSQTEGQYWTESAQAQGSLPGHTFDSAYGAINDTRQNLVSKSFTRN
jgi:hypothetical protein